MKKIVLSAALLLAAQSAMAADVLNCVDAVSEASHGRNFVVMTATIVSNTELKDFDFRGTLRPLTSAAAVKGTEITTNRSEYKGLIQYQLEDGFVLNLPAKLTRANLAKVFNTENGFSRENKHENGVVIGFANMLDPNADGEGGSHVSTRLHCSVQ